MLLGGLMVLSIGVSQQARGADELPACDSAPAEIQVKGVIADLSTLRGTDLTVSSLEDREDVSTTDAKVSCKGTAVLSDRGRYAMSYAFSRGTDGTVHVDVSLVMVPPCQSVRAQEMVVPFFNASDDAKRRKLTGMSLTGQQQQGGTQQDRMCNATMVLADGSRHAFDFRLYLKNGHVFGELTLK